MAVTTSYSFEFVESIDPVNVTGRSDATSLDGGGVAVSGDHVGHTDTTVFEPDGDTAGSQLVITGEDAANSQLNNGNIVVFSDTGTDMAFTILTSTGGFVSGPTAIGESGPDVLDPEVAALETGGFVIAYQDFFGGTDNDINIQIRDNNGGLIASIVPDSTGANDQNPSVAGLKDGTGGFAVAWHRNIGSSNEMWYAVYNADGTVRKAPALLDNFGTVNRNASVVALDNGGFAIAYEDNGWDGDIDITLARFDAAGNFVDWDDISQNTSTDGAPSATVLSNGMIAVGSTDDFFGHNDPVWTLVDQNTGIVLAESSIGTTHNDFDPSIAGMDLGQLATFHTDATSGDVVGQILQAVRFSTGDGANDTITGDELRDIVNAGDGNDTIRGGRNADELFGEGGDDTFILATGEGGTETVNGGTGQDRILVLSSVVLQDDASVTSIEEVEFDTSGVGPTTFQIYADQIGAGFSSTLLVDGNATGDADIFRVVMGTDTSVTLAGFTFQDFFPNDPSENDRLLVIGDDNAESITGSTLGDEISGNGGADRLNGFSGDDVLNGGAGADTLLGGGNDDLLDGGTQGDDLDGGGGIDTATYATSTAAVIVNLLTGTGGGGSANGDTLTLIEAVNGSNFDDTLTGNTLANTLRGGIGEDTIRGGGGSDTLNGGAGADRFNYSSVNDSGPAALRDVIANFEIGIDEINLQAIDANTTIAGNQAFVLDAGGAFSAGEIRQFDQGSNWLLRLNTDNDPAAEMEILLLNTNGPLTAGDFLL